MYIRDNGRNIGGVSQKWNPRVLSRPIGVYRKKSLDKFPIYDRIKVSLWFVRKCKQTS